MFLVQLNIFFRTRVNKTNEIKIIEIFLIHFLFISKKLYKVKFCNFKYWLIVFF